LHFGQRTCLPTCSGLAFSAWPQPQGKVIMFVLGYWPLEIGVGTNNQ
jgi:hypothetical protein